MTHALSHRGPDADGHAVEHDGRLALGHRRLSILDLSPTGAQPMASACGRFVISFNGEVYNHLDLRDQLGSQSWLGTSDTETLLVAFREWGVERTLQRANGMWAFALWDRTDQTLTLARDRFGKKPLLIAPTKDGLAWASEIQALRSLPDCPQQVDRDAVHAYLQHGCVPAPLTILSGVKKLPPASYVQLKARDLDRLRRDALEQRVDWVLSQAKTYWSAAEVARAGLENPLQLPFDEIVDQLEGRLRASVARRCLADVPLGAFLSGGIDSSTIVALMQEQSSQAVRTFSIGFHEAGFDESSAAASVAEHLGTKHTPLTVDEAQALEVAVQLPSLYDEPFADSSQIPTYLVSQLARQEVTVALSGDGGDELFAGYNRHVWVPRFERRFGAWPGFLRRGVAAGLGLLSEAGWNRFYGMARFALPKVSHPGRKIAKIARLLRQSDRDGVYRALTSFCPRPEQLLAQPGGAVSTWSLPSVETLGTDSATHQLMLADQLGYLPDDILVKLDRASMAVSLEGRNPILDPEVFALAWQIPLEQQLRDGGKSVLRAVLARHVPRELFERPKQGFSIPLSRWLRGGLRDWSESLLAHETLERVGLLDPVATRKLWASHLQGREDHSQALWAVLMLQAWSERTALRG